MREIKFRGKDIGSGRWVYGDLVHYENGDVAILEKPFSAYGYEATQIDRRTQVSPETIGQFTGLHDKNGKEIYEGDIIIHTSFPNLTEPVIFHSVAFWVKKILLSTYHGSVLKVIGNIYENPELLEAEHEDNQG